MSYTIEYNREIFFTEEDGVISYEKWITTVDDLKLIPYYVDNKGLKMKLDFSKR